MIEGPRAEIKATHFGPKGEGLLLTREDLHKPKQTEKKPEKRGILSGFFKKEQEKVVQEPEGAKSVMIDLQEMNAINRCQKVRAKLWEPITKLKTGDVPDMFTERYLQMDGVVSMLGAAEKEKLAMPPAIEKIYSRVNPDKQDHITDFRIDMGIIELQSANGISVLLVLPDEIMTINPERAKPDELKLVIRAPAMSKISQSEAIASIQEEYANKEKMLPITDAMITYAENVAEVLPEVARMRLLKKKIEINRSLNGTRNQTEQGKVTEEEPIVLTEAENKKLAELKAKYPDHPLLSNNFKEVPSNYRSVYCVVTEERFARMAQAGLMPETEYLNKNAPVRVEIDKIFDAVAPEGYSRTYSVYAYPTMDVLKNRSGPTPAEEAGNVIVEIKVDPKKVLVTDMVHVTEAMARRMQSLTPDQWVEAYWAEAEKLSDYLNGDDTKSFPEVIIPGGVRPEMMRAVSVIVQDTK